MFYIWCDFQPTLPIFVDFRVGGQFCPPPPYRIGGVKYPMWNRVKGPSIKDQSDESKSKHKAIFLDWNSQVNKGRMTEPRGRTLLNRRRPDSRGRKVPKD